VTRTVDEDGHVAYEFKDKLDRVLLQRQVNGTASSTSTNHDTYYVYDDFGNLRYVLPPALTDLLTGSGTYPATNTHIKNFAYIYKYDNRNRCIEKKLPGADPVYYVYDKADRLIFSQDGEQRTNSKSDWTYNKYDAFNRIVLTGLWQNSGKTQTQLTNQYRDSLATEQFLATAPQGYTWNTLTWVPNSSTVLQVNYYDNYQFKSRAPFSSNAAYNYTTPSGFADKRYGTDAAADAYKAKGLLTGSITCLLDNPATQLGTVYYYDSRGQVIESIEKNHLNGYEKETSITRLRAIPPDGNTSIRLPILLSGKSIPMLTTTPTALLRRTIS
jgi:YD repeat-containing protein